MAHLLCGPPSLPPAGLSAHPRSAGNHCNAHIAKGARWNAEKSQDGAYHSTKIWKVRLACAVGVAAHVVLVCHDMPCMFGSYCHAHRPSTPRLRHRVRCHAQNHGLRRSRYGRWRTMASVALDCACSLQMPTSSTFLMTSTSAACTVLVLPCFARRSLFYLARVDDPLFMLEHKAQDQEAGREQKDDLDALLAVRDEQYDNDYRASRLVRGQFRKRKADEIATVPAVFSLSLFALNPPSPPGAAQPCARNLRTSVAGRPS